MVMTAMRATILLTTGLNKLKKGLCKHKILYDVYKNFMRDLDSKHEKMQAKAKARVAQIDSLLATFVRNPRSKLLLNRLI